jgi:hypothetical protein
LEAIALNSDQIQARFGSYGVSVLSQNETLRLANLYSAHNGTQICRTLAVTRFILPVHPALADSDQRIRAGHSIGATLRSDGFRVIRSDALFTQCRSGDRVAALTAGTVPVGTALAVQLYSLSAMSANEQLPYATIAEAYHPEHVVPELSVDTLEEAINQTTGERQLALETLQQAL